MGGGDLPAIQSLGGRANVLLFAQEPFVAPQPGLLASLNASDWTSQVQPIETGFRVQAEKYADQNGGLGSPAPRDVSSPTGARYALVNQFAPDISVFSYAPPLGTAPAGAIPDVGFSPPPGAYAHELLIALASSDPAATVFYRLDDSNPWQTYAQPIHIASSAGIRAFAQRSDGAKSPVRRASYDLAALSRDADGNGLADAWEQRYNQHDPKADPDGDGFDNLAEFLAGTDPLDPASHPPGPPPAVPLNLDMVRDPETQEMMLRFSWADGASGFVLEHVDALGLTWVPEPAASRVEGDRTIVELPMDPAVPERFWRLRAP